MRNVLGEGKKSGEEPLTISQLTARLRATLEQGFPSVHVTGEISGWMVAASGHAYFTLKDAGAALSCVMWRSAVGALAFPPGDGIQVDARGGISVFEKRGNYQLTVSSMRRAGEGDLHKKFLELKDRLGREGLFDASRKRAIPSLPRAIGVVTSPTGAVIHDIRNVMKRRAPWVPVYLAPAKVQGAGAAAEIVAGIRLLAESGRVDVIIVGRGGGSLEDLWEFNSEGVARAVAGSPIPIISAVGHEVDFTICDFASDLRAPTPSAAAEIVSAGHHAIADRLATAARTLDRIVVEGIRTRRARVEAILSSYALRRPERELREMSQRLDTAQRRLPQAMDRRLERARLRITSLTGALVGHDPELILKKGYAIVRRERGGSIVRDPDKLRPGVILRTQVADGKIRSRVLPAINSQEDLFSSES